MSRSRNIPITARRRDLVERNRPEDPGGAHPVKAERSKSLPRTGELRQRRRVLSIDLLPMGVLEAIKLLRLQSGLTWQEIERLSSQPHSPKWRDELGKHGFVNWDELPEAAVK